MLKRTRAQEENEEYIEELKKDKEFNDLYTAYSKKNIEYLRSKIDEENLALKHDVEDLKIRIDAYLRTHDIPKDALLPKYECPICNDTGVVGGKICSCFLTELNNYMLRQTSSQTDFKSFEMMDSAIMNENDISASEFVKTWCEKYPNVKKININILGGVGAGKTFLLECVASELLKKGAAVSFITSFELNEYARKYHAGKSFEFSDYLNAEVLLIDDLGTEPMIKNVTQEYLYNLINTRQTHKRPTIITSNLGLEDILDRYGERIFSRLGNKNLSANILLKDDDKRLKR